jgi:hypothetical protein
MQLTRTLESNNWKLLCLEAINEIPEDLRVHVGYSELGKWFCITIAGDKVREFSEDEKVRESSLSEVVITWFDDIRSVGERVHRVTPDIDFDDLRDHRICPFVVVVRPPGRLEEREEREGFLPGDASARSFIRRLQIAILDEMPDDCLRKDHKGRFLRVDGSPILPWQFAKKRKR